MQCIAIIANTTRPRAAVAAHAAIELLSARGVDVVVDDATAKHLGPLGTSTHRVVDKSEFQKLADAVITFGGDGTLLSVARLLIDADVPIMGINVGRLGFLAEFSSDEVPQAIECLLSGAYRMVDRSTLEIEVGSVRGIAINEVIVERAAIAKMISVRAYVNSHHVADYSADGVIVATPTGSTAYSLAAGGPIVAPTAAALCITPIAPHTLTLRPLIVSDESEVKLELRTEFTEAKIVADGIVIGSIAPNQEVIVRKGAQRVKLIKRADSTYFDMLREKLLWSVDATRNP
ncbi:MAG: NAD(+)/NADH kinase [Ignavibacteria bacterium]|nr:NAD(+)/NADH kinase [Ignavibacteria bacterium]